VLARSLDPVSLTGLILIFYLRTRLVASLLTPAAGAVLL
jgi:hypothetical protein